MSACPNSTAGGCRCIEHDPGLLGTPAEHAGRARLHVVTTGPTDARQPGTRTLDQHLADARDNCPACQGDAQRCNDGNGAPSFGRLHGCIAWTPAGKLAQPAKAQPRQPWEAKPPRHLRTAA